MMAGNGAYVIFVIQPDGNDGNTFKGVMQRLSKAVVITIVRCAASAGVVAGEFLVFIAESKATYGIGKKGYNEKTGKCGVVKQAHIIPFYLSVLVELYAYTKVPEIRNMSALHPGGSGRSAGYLPPADVQCRHPPGYDSLAFGLNSLPAPVPSALLPSPDRQLPAWLTVRG